MRSVYSSFIAGLNTIRCRVIIMNITSRMKLTKPGSPPWTYLLGGPIFRLLGRRSSDQNTALSQAKRILISRLDKIGDVVMTSGFLRELRRGFPTAHLTLLVRPAVFNLVEACPYVDEVLTFHQDALHSRSLLRLHSRAIRYARQHLWNRKFDLALVPRWDVDFYLENYLAYYSGAPVRVGYTERTTPPKAGLNHGEDLLFTNPLDQTNLAHEVEHNLDFIRFLGKKVRDTSLELWLTEEDHGVVRQFLQAHQVAPQDFLIAIGPGAGHPRRIWPLARFLRVSHWLANQLQARIVILGGPEEKAAGNSFRARSEHSVINAAGTLTVRQSAALLQRCGLFLGNDSGLLHLAAAAGLPVAEISCHPRTGEPAHYNSPIRFGPWNVPAKIIQPVTAAFPCSPGCEAETAHCILGISAERVVNELQTWLPHILKRDDID